MAGVLGSCKTEALRFCGCYCVLRLRTQDLKKAELDANWAHYDMARENQSRSDKNRTKAVVLSVESHSHHQDGDGCGVSYSNGGGSR